VAVADGAPRIVRYRSARNTGLSSGGFGLILLAAFVAMEYDDTGGPVVAVLAVVLVGLMLGTAIRSLRSWYGEWIVVEPQQLSVVRRGPDGPAPAITVPFAAVARFQQTWARDAVYGYAVRSDIRLLSASGANLLHVRSGALSDGQIVELAAVVGRPVQDVGVLPRRIRRRRAQATRTAAPGR
jgi:hypothetical protein